VSKPVQEPTNQRQHANEAWAIRQLQRRPGPSAGQTPCLRAAFNSNTITLTVPNNTETAVVFDQWENEDSTIFGEGTIAGNLVEVRMLAQGVYSITAALLWDNSFDAYQGMVILDDSAASGEGTFFNPNMGMYKSRWDESQFIYPLTFSATRKYPLLGVTPGDVVAGQYGRAAARVFQLSGVPQDAISGYLDVYYHGPTMTSI
jgi:hypothetical protein